MLDALVNFHVEPQPKKRVCSKRHHSSHTKFTDNEARPRKKERKELDRSRLAALIDEEIRQIGELKINDGASSSTSASSERSTIDVA